VYSRVGLVEKMVHGKSLRRALSYNGRLVVFVFNKKPSSSMKRVNQLFPELAHLSSAD